jgi:hypothetical protein
VKRILLWGVLVALLQGDVGGQGEDPPILQNGKRSGGGNVKASGVFWLPPPGS